MRRATMTILPLKEPAGAALSASKLAKLTTSPSSPAAGVGGDSPSAAATSGCVRGEVIWALSAPRTQAVIGKRSEEHTSELQSRLHLLCRLLLVKKKTTRRCDGI